MPRVFQIPLLVLIASLLVSCSSEPDTSAERDDETGNGAVANNEQSTQASPRAESEFQRPIDDLAGRDEAARQAAAQRLIGAGAKAVPAILEVARGENPETAARAVGILVTQSESDTFETALAARDALRTVRNEGPAEAGRLAGEALLQQIQPDIEALQQMELKIEMTEHGTVKAIDAHVPKPKTSMQHLEGEGLAHLARMIDLETLNLKKVNLSDRNLRHLKGLVHLRVLDLEQTGVYDNGVKHLVALKDLKDLNLYRTRVSALGLTFLRGMENLQMKIVQFRKNGGRLKWDENGNIVAVDLSKPVVEDITLRSQIPWEGNLSTDQLLNLIARRTEVRDVNLYNTYASDETLKKLKGYRKLRRLNLDSTSVTDEGLKLVGGFTELEDLDLDATRVSDEGLEHLAGLTALKRLSLRNTDISDVGLKHLVKFSNLEQLNLDHGDITEAGFAQLKQLSKLKQLSLKGTKISNESIQSLLRANAN